MTTRGVRRRVHELLSAEGDIEVAGEAGTAAGAYRRTTGADAQELAAAVHRVWWERLNDFWMLRWRYQLLDRRADP